MHIAILGPGGIGSTFAFQLARAGHDVTVIARNQRLADLQRDPAIVDAAGQRAPVTVSAALDPTIAYDLVLVPVLASQVDAVLPALTASAATTIMFMFNTFEPLDRLRDAVGPARFAFGFPAILANISDGKLTSQIVKHGLVTTVTESAAAWASIFINSGIPTTTTPDMESWLRTHAAFVVPAMIAGIRAHERGAGIPWSEAMQLARATIEGFHLVRRLGNQIVPGPMRPIGRMPAPLLAAMLWGMSRNTAFRKTGAAGPGEPRTLIDAMHAAAPGSVPRLLSLRP